ncbi:acyl carrier protein [Kibdelosporangium persicum]|uniref:D-alanine--poly(Phosphoribitol) ligase subunit 2 n=1 Tax=Kibdelosporangium persicum TaxID=2698649 RepID=A0ABX2F5P0_9PSEU|nr:acyl carrier protein [Kibdelosporangium persicum]NRN66577.1 D-alanine--poly(Phosphoribitol) ligase subunit 2 [Kibdelosporangium persicum]
MTINEAATPALAAQIQAGLLAFLEAKTKQVVAPGQDIFGTGLATSMFALELVVHLEGTYGIEIAGPDLRLEHFRTVEKMTALTLRLKAEAESTDSA